MITKPVTRENVEHLLDSGLLYVAMANDRWWQARRNGKTRRWKKDPTRIEIPFKCGFKICDKLNTDDGYFQLGAFDPKYFRHRDDVPQDRRPS